MRKHHEIDNLRKSIKSKSAILSSMISNDNEDICISCTSNEDEVIIKAKKYAEITVPANIKSGKVISGELLDDKGNIWKKGQKFGKKFSRAIVISDLIILISLSKLIIKS